MKSIMKSFGLAIVMVFAPVYAAFAQPESVFPAFPAPADTLDAIFYDDGTLARTESVMLATLQGVVNTDCPQIYLLSVKRGGLTEWGDRLGIKTNPVPTSELYSLVKKYVGHIKGLVVYSDRLSPHYINLACTVAGLNDAIAVTENEKKKLQKNGIDIPVVCDISDLTFKTPVDIYTYLYDNYWTSCTRKTMLSLNPRVLADIRDLGTAMNAAFIWLDPRKNDEREVLKKFLADLVPGETVILGWWHEERAGIGIATSYGLSTVPSDFYNNATVYAGYPRKIQPARIPKRKPLENKVYVALFLSDGDNIQYCEHKMIRLWENPERGDAPINWTVSPALADLGPSLLNYFYETSSENDCLVSGPSGMGYSLIYDELNDIWHASTRETIEEYTKLTQKYLQKSGLRIITIWDRVSKDQMEAYSDNCPYLQGVTLEDWKRAPRIPTTICDDRLAFIGNRPCYTSYVEDMFQEWADSIKVYDGKAPAFFTSQGESWNMGPDQMVKLQAMFDSIEPGRVEICRADHFFSYFNQANGMDFNILMLDDVNISTTAGGDVSAIADGSFAERHTWVADRKGKQSVVIDLGCEYLVDRLMISNASAAGLDASYNIREFTIETSRDRKKWETADKALCPDEDIIDKYVTPVQTRYIRLKFKPSEIDGNVRVADLEIYGKSL